MEVTEIRTVATAAVRDAANGAGLIEAAATLGSSPRCCRASRRRWRRARACCPAFPMRTAWSATWAAAAWSWSACRTARAGERVSFPLGVLRIAGLARQAAGVARRQADPRGGLDPARAGPALLSGRWIVVARAGAARHASDRLSAADHPSVQHEPGADRDARPHHRPSRQAAPARGAGPVLRPGGHAGRRHRALRPSGTRTGQRETIASTYGLREGLLHAGLDADTRARTR